MRNKQHKQLHDTQYGKVIELFRIANAFFILQIYKNRKIRESN